MTNKSINAHTNMAKNTGSQTVVTNTSILSIELCQQVIELVPHSTLILNLDSQIVYANEASTELLHYKQDELLGMPLGELIPECTDIFLAFRTQYFKECGQQFNLGKSENLSIIRKNKSTLYVEVRLSSFETAEDNLIMASLVDINEHCLTELELSRSNDELDQFAYVASHDLKAPLRGIDNLITWIWEDIDDKALVTEHIQMTRYRLQRAQALLDDLLEYSRLGKEESDFSEVDINFMAQDLYLQSSPPEKSRLELGKEIEPFMALATPLSQALRNLINNAIKHHDKESAIIKVEAFDLDDFIEIIVSDNGPGIEEKYHEQIFGMFEKLKSKDEVEGSGMGLAMVKKIVLSAKGSITVSSALGEGAKFCMRWPKHIDKDIDKSSPE